MELESLILIVHVALAIGIVALVLLQRGKGAEAGASFGAGASQTVFGSSGSGNFLTRTTAILATLFFVTSFGLAIIAKQKASQESDVGIPDTVTVEQIEGTPQSADEAIQLPELGDTPSVESPEEGDLPDLSDLPAVDAATESDLPELDQ